MSDARAARGIAQAPAAPEIRHDFALWAGPGQVPPRGSWRVWVFVGGRGAGKTRAGAEWVHASVDETAARAGASLFAIGREDGCWEIVAARRLTLVSPGLYEAALFLRGLCGAEGAMGRPAPVGAPVVRLDGALARLDLDASLADGAVALSWVRRARIGGGDWTASEPPLGEDRERYRLEVLKDRAPVRAVETEAPVWTYGPAEQRADFGDLPGWLAWRVAQLSAVTGPGGRAESSGAL